MQVPKNEPQSVVDVHTGMVIRISQQHPDEQPALLVQLKPPEPDDAPLDATELLEPTLALLELALELTFVDALDELLVAPP